MRFATVSALLTMPRAATSMFSRARASGGNDARALPSVTASGRGGMATASRTEGHTSCGEIRTNAHSASAFLILTLITWLKLPENETQKEVHNGYPRLVTSVGRDPHHPRGVLAS